MKQPGMELCNYPDGLTDEIREIHAYAPPPRGKVDPERLRDALFIDGECTGEGAVGMITIGHMPARPLTMRGITSAVMLAHMLDVEARQVAVERRQFREFRTMAGIDSLERETATQIAEAEVGVSRQVRRAGRRRANKSVGRR